MHLICVEISNTLRIDWLSGNESACPCRKHRFDPRVGKIPWKSEWKPTPISLPGKPHGGLHTVHGVAKT